MRYKNRWKLPIFEDCQSGRRKYSSNEFEDSRVTETYYVLVFKLFLLHLEIFLNVVITYFA